MDAETFAFSDFRAVLWRSKWVFVLAAVSIPLAALLFSINQSRLYEAKARVALNSRPLPSALTGSAPTAAPSAPTAQRYLQTQAILAATMPVAEIAVQKAGLIDRSARGLLNTSQVTADPSADVLVFTVEDEDRAATARLATAYAQAFVDYRASLDRRAAIRILADLESDLTRVERQLRTAPAPDLGALSRRYTVMLEQMQGLRSYLAVQEQDALLANPADHAILVRPQTTRNVLIGIGLGLVFGVVAAFLYDALSPRIRSLDEIGTILQMPILGRLPAPPRSSARSQHPVLLTRPETPQAETFRILRARLALVNEDNRTVMLSSAVKQEGKSTTVANLGVAFAQFGRRVALIDLDLNHPYLHHFFDIEQTPGASEVVSGDADLLDALREIELPRSTGGSNGRMPDVGELAVLPLGSPVENPAQFLASSRLEGLLEDVRGLMDLVLVDTGPLLGVSHPIVLSSQIEALVFVLRPDMLSLRDLYGVRDVLDALPPKKLGIVLTNIKAEHPYPPDPSGVDWPEPSISEPVKEQSISQRVREHLSLP